MAYKIYVKSNYFYIVDTDTDKIFEGLAKDVRVRKEFVDSTDFIFENVNGFSTSISVPFADIQDESGVAYTDVATFVDFYEANTGNFNSGGATPQAREIILKIDNNNAVTILKNTSGLNPTFTIANQSIGKDNLTSNLNLGGFNVWFLNEYTNINDTITDEASYKFDCYQDDGNTIKIIKRVLDFSIDFVGLSFVNQYILGDSLPYDNSIIQIILND